MESKLAERENIGTDDKPDWRDRYTLDELLSDPPEQAERDDGVTVVDLRLKQMLQAMPGLSWRK